VFDAPDLNSEHGFTFNQRLEGSTAMAKTISIVAPPYHVQSTAAELRSGFPYFSYHESVSKLWAEKWRKPCQQGIYPFTDGDVGDFDPIFDELVRMSVDGSDILFRPDEYAKTFFPVAENLVALAGQAESRGDNAKARDLFLRAAAVYRIARFPINRSRVSQRAWERGKEAYLKAGQYLNPPSVAVDVPFTHTNVPAGDIDVAIQAYLRTPNGTRPKDGWPVLLFICGLDAYKTDHTPRTQTHVDHGFATLSFEIPGTGDCPAAPNDPASPDRLMSSVLDWVAANAFTYSFDLTKVVARGISTGGYYAMRIAHTHADRLFAVVAQGGGCHHMFDPAWIQAQNQMEYPFALADAMAFKFGYREADPVAAYAADARKFSLLESGVLDRPSCKLLLINGMEDSIFPMEDNFIVAVRGDKKDLLARGNRQHMGNPGAEDILYSWIDDAVAGKP
jgi:Esterase FrsA-like